MSDQYLIFDGTTRLGEAMAIVVGFVDDSITIQLSLKLLVKSMIGEENARELINVISAQYSRTSIIRTPLGTENLSGFR